MASYRVEEWLRRLRTLLEQSAGVRVEVDQVSAISAKDSGKCRVADQTGTQAPRGAA